jgi:thiamine pyrophosphokinase
VAKAALVVADATPAPRRLVRGVLPGVDTIVGVDGGADRALKAGLRVDWLIGDLDGVTAATRSRIPKNRTIHDPDPDHTDLEKAIRFLHGRGYRAATIVGATGGRLDHTLGTLAILAAWHKRMDLRVVDQDFTTVIVDPSIEFEAPIGTMVSLLAPAGATGVTTRGLRFALRGKRLPFSPLGIHNEVASNPVRVEVRRGPLFLLRSHRVRPHA